MNKIQGDLTTVFDEGKVDIIAHCANAWVTMGSGVARAIVDKWPEVAEVDKTTKRGDINKLGTFSVIDVQRKCDRLGRVYNLYGQFNFGYDKKCYLIYDAISLGMYKINALEKGKRVGLPYLIGCGLAGGDWTIMEDIIKNQLVDCDVTIVEYKE